MIYKYAITEVDFYDDYPGYGDIIMEAAAAGLKHWSDLNDIRFQYVQNPELEDFIITMDGTGEGGGFLGRTDTYGMVNEIGCLAKSDQDCTITLFVEDYTGKSLELHSFEAITFVVAHEMGHLFGFPHHGSSLHIMYSPMDSTRSWYDDRDYGLVTPHVLIPHDPTIRNDYDFEFIQLPTRDEVYADHLGEQ